MKKRGIVIIVLLCVLAISAGIITYAFYANKVAETSLTFESSAATEISFNVSTKDTQHLYPRTTSVDGSYGAIDEGKPIFIKLTYKSFVDREMGFAITNINYKVDNLDTTLETYYNSLFEFSFIECSDIKDDDNAIGGRIPTDNSKWFNLAEFNATPNPADNKLTITTRNDGCIAVFIRIKSTITSELIPEMLYNTNLEFSLIAR